MNLFIIEKQTEGRKALLDSSYVVILKPSCVVYVNLISYIRIMSFNVVKDVVVL